MKNPFPGMNPWLELDWTEVHSGLGIYSRDQLRGRMPPGLRVRVERSLTVSDDGGGARTYRPDVHVSEAWDGPEGLGGAGGLSTTTTEVVEASPGIEVLVEPWEQKHLEVTDATGAVITVIEFLSPANKRGEGRGDYRAKQHDYLAAGLSLVEIDLVRAGSYSLALAEGVFPSRPDTLYRACVTRSTSPNRRIAYPIALRERLPRLPIPLRPDDRDAVLDLQPVVDLCCENGGYSARDYARPLSPPLGDEDARFAEELLAAAGIASGEGDLG